MEIVPGTRYCRTLAREVLQSRTRMLQQLTVNDHQQCPRLGLAGVADQYVLQRRARVGLAIADRRRYLRGGQGADEDPEQ